MTRIGSLFSGYGGLDMAVAGVTGGETVWVSDIDKGACKILAHRYPDVPNLGDVTGIDWATVTPADIICAGFPCQDVSHAGKRAGLKDGTRTGLWAEVVRAITELQPRMVVLENVAGIFTAPGPSDVEPCAWCVGDGSTVDLRAFGVVLADLAALGFDAEWVSVRASDVGAPHRRERWFCVAYPADADSFGGERGGSTWDGSTGSADGDREPLTGLLPTPTARDWKNVGDPARLADRMAARSQALPEIVVNLLPTPAVNDMGAGKTVDAWDAWTDRMRESHANGNGHGKSLHIEAARLLPTPSVADALGGHERRGGSRGDELLLNGMAKAGHLGRFGQYAPAIERWERVLGRAAPAPTEQTGRNDAHRLSPAFVEWMMGLPAGWVTDVPGITRNEALKACGNGVVPQQAAHALRLLLNRLAVAA